MATNWLDHRHKTDFYLYVYGIDGILKTTSTNMSTLLTQQGLSCFIHQWKGSLEKEKQVYEKYVVFFF